MARANNGPPSRAALQVTLVGVLIASVGAAAMVDRVLASSAVKLGPEQVRNVLHIRLPAGWVTSTEPADDQRIVAMGQEEKRPRRTVMVFLERLRRTATPVFYLQQSGLAASIFGDGEAEELEAISVGGHAGIYAFGHTASGIGAGDEPQLETQMVVCCIFPNRYALTIWLSKEGQGTGADRDLLKRIADSVKMDGL